MKIVTCSEQKPCCVRCLAALPFPVQVFPGPILRARPAGIPPGAEGRIPPPPEARRSNPRARGLGGQSWTSCCSLGELVCGDQAFHPAAAEPGRLLVMSLPSRRHGSAVLQAPSKEGGRVLPKCLTSETRSRFFPQNCSPWRGALGCRAAPAPRSPPDLASSFLVDVPTKHTCESSRPPVAEQGRPGGRWATCTPPAARVSAAGAFWVQQRARLSFSLLLFTAAWRSL